MDNPDIVLKIIIVKTRSDNLTADAVLVILQRFLYLYEIWGISYKSNQSLFQVAL